MPTWLFRAGATDKWEPCCRGPWFFVTEIELTGIMPRSDDPPRPSCPGRSRGRAGRGEEPWARGGLWDTVDAEPCAGRGDGSPLSWFVFYFSWRKISSGFKPRGQKKPLRYDTGGAKVV